MTKYYDTMTQENRENWLSDAIENVFVLDTLEETQDALTVALSA